MFKIVFKAIMKTFMVMILALTSLSLFEFPFTSFGKTITSPVMGSYVVQLPDGRIQGTFCYYYTLINIKLMILSTI